MVISANVAGFGLSTVLRFQHDTIKTFLSGALKVVLYIVLYLMLGVLFLEIALNIELVYAELDDWILKFIASVGGGLSWVAIVSQIGLILGLIRRAKIKTS